MKKILTHADRDRGILHVTIADSERWYTREIIDPELGIPTFAYLPSVNYITSVGYPKGIGYLKALARDGWESFEERKIAGGERGSKVHQASWDLLAGRTLSHEETYRNPTTEQMEPLSWEEYEGAWGFRDWCAVARPTVLLREHVVWDEAHGFAGTLDLVALLQEPPGLFLIDLKTSPDVYAEHRLQVSAYGEGLRHDLPTAITGRFIPNPPPPLRLGILQVGSRVRNQRHWKFTEVEDAFDVFLAARRIWEYETDAKGPQRIDYPLTLSLNGGPPVAVAATPKRRKVKLIA